MTYGDGVSNIDIKKLLNFGVDKVILGTAAVENIDFLKSACEKFRNKIAISLDVVPTFALNISASLITQLFPKKNTLWIITIVSSDGLKNSSTNRVFFHHFQKPKPSRVQV